MSRQYSRHTQLQLLNQQLLNQQLLLICHTICICSFMRIGKTARYESSKYPRNGVEAENIPWLEEACPSESNNGLRPSIVQLK